MPCPFARFVVHFLDGTTIHEDRSNPDAWKEVPNKQDIVAMGIDFDPQLLYYPVAKDEKGKPIPIVDPVSGVHLKERYAEPILKGSKKYYYSFFQMKDKIRKLAGRGNVTGGVATPTGRELSLIIGRVVDSFPWIDPKTGEQKIDQDGKPLLDGHCEVKYGTVARQTKSFYTTVRSLGFIDENSLLQQGIVLEDCGKLRTEVNK